MTGYAPRFVLDQHVSLHDQLIRPSDMLAGMAQYFMEDAVSKSGDRAFGMFYPLNLARGIGPRQGAQLAQILGNDLTDADTYEVTAEMLHVLGQVSLDATNAVDQLVEAELPCPAAFCWLDEPWLIRDVAGLEIPVRALTWKHTTVGYDGTIVGAVEPEGGWPIHGPDGNRFRMVYGPAVRVAQWVYWEDDLQHGTMDEETIESGRQQLGDLSLMHVMTVPFGVRFADHENYEQSNHPDSALHMMHVLWSFLGAEITTTHHPPIERGVRRRALRSLTHGEVNVIILRRPVHDPDEPGWVHKVDWSCRWIVNGHYRHAEGYDPEIYKEHKAAPTGSDKHCAVCGGPLTWIRPYLKGPDGMPLKVSGGTVRKLAR